MHLFHNEAHAGDCVITDLYNQAQKTILDSMQ